MTPGNFNWLIHAMLFYHTKYVLKKQRYKKQKKATNEQEEDLGLDEDSEPESEDDDE